ncbi:MAG: hypothetical protein E5Y04_23725 [Mesorhizobium sp.]|nr:MAG: hypothetical protein E5Y04_23725 [Mesorhizobium sp.]
MSSDHFNGHIHRDAFEKLLRDTFDTVCKGASAGDDPVLACQGRASEVLIRFALFIADEMNAGTSAEVLMDGGCRVIGNMVENLARGFAGDAGEDILGSIITRVAWAASEDESDLAVEVQRPQSMGGSA